MAAHLLSPRCDLIRSGQRGVRCRCRLAPPREVKRQRLAGLRAVSEGLRAVSEGLRAASERLRAASEGLKAVFKGLKAVFKELKALLSGHRRTRCNLRPRHRRRAEYQADLRHQHHGELSQRHLVPPHMRHEPNHLPVAPSHRRKRNPMVHYGPESTRNGVRTSGTLYRCVSRPYERTPTADSVV